MMYNVGGSVIVDRLCGQVVIMLVIDKENDRALLSHLSRFVPRMWSCLAGFMEVFLFLHHALKDI